MPFFQDTTPFVLALLISIIILIFISFFSAFRKNKNTETNANKERTSQNSQKNFEEDKEKTSSSNNNREKNKNEDTRENRSSLQDDINFFNLKENYTLDELKSARKRLIQENHPDKVNHMSYEIKKTAKKQTQKINEVFSRLEKKFKNN